MTFLTFHFEVIFFNFMMSNRNISNDQAAAGDFMLMYLSDELHNLSQVLFFLQNLLGLSTQGHKLREVLVVILVQRARVLAVADQPVHGREVLPLSQLLIQTPEDL